MSHEHTKPSGGLDIINNKYGIKEDLVKKFPRLFYNYVLNVQLEHCGRENSRVEVR